MRLPFHLTSPRSQSCLCGIIFPERLDSFDHRAPFLSRFPLFSMTGAPNNALFWANWLLCLDNFSRIKQLNAPITYCAFWLLVFSCENKPAFSPTSSALVCCTANFFLPPASSAPLPGSREIKVTHITLSARRRKKIRGKLNNVICIQLHNKLVSPRLDS